MPELGIVFQCVEHLVAVHFRHDDVQQHEIEIGLRQHVQGLPAIFRADVLVSLTIQPAAKHVAVHFAIVHNQNSSRGNDGGFAGKICGGQ